VLGLVASLRGRSRVVHGAIALAGVALLFASVASGPAARGVAVGFNPGLRTPVFIGQTTTISVFVQPGSALCTLSIRYTGGRTDRRTGAAPRLRVAWNVRIPAVPPGPASVTVSCKGSGTAKGTMLVQWPLQAPLLTLGQSGWSQRNRSAGTGSDVSYGLAVKNERARFDAVNVNVLVNFVDDTNRVLGTARKTIGLIPAGGTYYVGGLLGLATQTAVTRLEIVVGPAKSAQKVETTPPLISDVVIIPNKDGVYVDSVQGQLLNTSENPMQSADVGIVLVDSAGNIAGGGSTSAPGPVQHGAREFFRAASSFGPVPLSRASSALVSAVPRYLSTP
jgi:hypothetical protein